MLECQVGCSGFYYPEWKGIFYPEDLPQRKWFEYYCQHFNTVELNVTFYRFPKLEFFKNWYDRSPADFTFCIKAPRLITHYKKFKDAQTLLHDFYGRIIEGLREKVGCVLFQFPASFTYDEETLEHMVALLNRSFRNVLEFRHVSWWQDAVYKKLTENKIIFCGMSHPKLPDEVIATTDTVYYRFHGVPELYYSKYDPLQLQQVFDKISAKENIKNVYLYFNNTANGSALLNAAQLNDYSLKHIIGR